MASKTRQTKTPEVSGVIGKVSEAVSSVTSQTQEAVIDAWDELDDERQQEIIAIPLLALALISFLSLISFHPQDIAVITQSASSQTETIHNWIGTPGAWLAHSIVNVFGAVGYVLPAFFLIWAVDRIRPMENQLTPFRIFGFVILGVCLSTLIGLIAEHTTPIDSLERAERIWRTSGAIGYVFSRRLLEMGPVGAYITALTCTAVSLLVCTPFLFTNFFYQVMDFLFPLRDEDEIDADDYDDEDVSTLSPLNEDGEGLPTLEDWDDVPYEPPIINTDQEELDELPALTGEQSEWVSEFSDFDPEKNEEPLNEPVIITKEEDPVEEVDMGVNLVTTPSHMEYQLPPLDLLDKPENNRTEVDRDEIIYNSHMLEKTLKEFNIPVKVVEVNYGPTLTCYELEPAPGIKISRIENLANDITRALKACSVRIVAPIPGKGTVGVEVPNRNRSDVFLRDILACESYKEKKSKLKIALGKTISGEPFVFDLIKAPHLLVAGATGSGKSVCINSIISSFLYNAAPHEVKLMLVDPKQVELALYRDIPHLLCPVITDPKKAGAALRWVVEEMDTRYRYLKKCGVRNITEYNKKRMAQQEGKIAETESSAILPGFLPYIVVVIDELADLMMMVRVEVETAIARLAAMARAVGIHLVLATQRPSVDVLTGVIKNNFPSRMAFQVSSAADSRTILDMKGAESLLGRGDMLVSPGGANKPIRLQSSYISTEELEEVCEFVKSQQDVEYVMEEFTPLEDSSSGGSGYGDANEEDELYQDAVSLVLENDAASTSLLQRRMKIGYGRAARLLDLMEENGIVGPPRGSKPREVVLNKG